MARQRQLPQVGTEMQMPSVPLAALADINWTSVSDFFRFRPDNRPSELVHEDIIVISLGKRTAALISSPQLAGRVLGSDSARFPKSRLQYRVGYRAFGPGISGTVGAQNQHQINVLAPLFSGRQAKATAAIAHEATQDAVRTWQSAGRIDLFQAFSRLTLDIVWATLLGPNRYDGQSAEVAAAVEQLSAIPKADFVDAAHVIHGLDDAFIQMRRAQNLASDNPLRKACETGSLTPAELRANRIVLAASGHLTTALTLSWGLWAIAASPHLRANVREILAQGASLRPFLREVFSEALRLWPPGAETSRDCAEDVELAGQHLPKGALVVISFYAMHRRPEIWNNPNGFQPGRFGKGAPAIPSNAFMPFSGGMNRCPGKSLAWAELLSIGETLLKSYDLCVPANEAKSVRVTPGTCLYPDRPLWADIKARAA